jgi:hypothetical protein
MKNAKWQLLFKFSLIAFLFTLLMACGYGFAPTGEYIDKRIRNIYVEQFGNKTSQAELENYIRTAFINQFILTSRFKIVDSVELADATVKGDIVNFIMAPLSYSSNTLVAEERATITLDVTFREREGGKTIWSAKSIQGTVDYKIDNNINLLPATRKNALIKLSNDTAERIFNQMMANF